MKGKCKLYKEIKEIGKESLLCEDCIIKLKEGYTR